MLFSMFVVPFYQPSPGGGIALLWAGVDLLSQSVLLLLLIAWTQMPWSRGWEWNSSFARQWVRENPWTLPFLVALCMVPTSLVGRTVLGGAINSYHTLYYLIAAVGLSLVQSTIKGMAEPGRRIPGLLLFVSLAAVACQPPASFKYLRQLPRIWDNPQQRAYEFVRAHPGQAYFPWHPMAGLLAEGRLYHFQYGVIDRMVAGFAPSREHFRAHIPANLRFVVYRKQDLRRAHHKWDKKLRRTYLPEYSKEIQLGELPGWVAYVQDEG
jgi:hypothetical protein